MASSLPPNKAELIKQAQNIWSMLDNMAADDPNSYRKFIDKNINEGKEYMKWSRTPPEAHMCVKTKLMDKKCKTLYMNVCSWIRVPEPKSDDAPIPVMSSEICDLNANVCVVNVAFAASILESYGRSASNQDEQTALINLAIDYVQDVHKVRIHRTFTILSEPFHGPWDKVVQSLRGKIEPDDSNMEEMIQSMRPDLTQEEILTQLSRMKTGEDEEPQCEIKLPTQSPVSKKVLIEEIEEPCEIVEPGYRLRSESTGQGRRLVLDVDLHGVSSVSQCQLDITQEEVSLLVKNRYQLNLRLPEPILDDQARAKFSKKTSSLTVTMPTRR